MHSAILSSGEATVFGCLGRLYYFLCNTFDFSGNNFGRNTISIEVDTFSNDIYFLLQSLNLENLMRNKS